MKSTKCFLLVPFLLFLVGCTGTQVVEEPQEPEQCLSPDDLNNKAKGIYMYGYSKGAKDALLICAYTGRETIALPKGEVLIITCKQSESI